VRAFLVLVMLALVIGISFCLGYAVNEMIKPPLPEVGNIELIGGWDEVEGNLYCFNEESFESLSDLLTGMGEHFDTD
jgi:hypothetical protein